MKKIAYPLLKALTLSILMTVCIILFFQIQEYYNNKLKLENLLQNPPTQQELVIKGANDMSMYGVNGKIYHCYRCVDQLGGCDTWENRVCTREEFVINYEKEYLLNPAPLTFKAFIIDLFIFIRFIPIFPIIFLISLLFFYSRQKNESSV